MNRRAFMTCLVATAAPSCLQGPTQGFRGCVGFFATRDRELTREEVRAFYEASATYPLYACTEPEFIGVFPVQIKLIPITPVSRPFREDLREEAAACNKTRRYYKK